MGTGSVDQGWEAASSSDESPPIVINFGSNAWTEVQGVDKDEVVGDVRARFAFGNQWTRDDLLEVTGKHPDRERLYIRNYPQIYCPGQETSWVSFAEWAIANRSATSILFDGVTSENKGSRLCGTTNGTNISLFWQESWPTLNDALLASDIINGSHIPEPLRRSVISFYHSHLSIDEP